MKITVNGDLRAVPDGLSLKGLLDTLELDSRMVVVEHNRTIVRRPELDSTNLADGDQIELVHFVGGG
ncbi:MAG: sulfur carrier protein ThiS [Gemmatimonadota bacterium]|nr:sulfur carrier protein ThiS [Gemmatimonadota bacterium]MDH5804188.1 sulfur carrier protein ThiS [Gemmatimonadota bacterium]